MNLPSVQGQFQVVRRENPNAKRDFSLGWGAKNEGIKPGDFIQGVILGFELNQYGSKNIILKSFTHNLQRVKVFGCTSLELELHSDKLCTNLIWNPGDVVQITYIKTYMGTKGRGTGKPISIFQIDELVGYQLTQYDVNDIQTFVAEQIQKQPLAHYTTQVPPVGNNQYVQPVYNQPQQMYAPQQPHYAPVPQQYAPQQTPYVQTQPAPVYNVAQPRAQFKQTASDDSFDI